MFLLQRAHKVEEQRLQIADQRRRGHWSDLRRVSSVHDTITGSQIGGPLEGWKRYRVKPSFFDVIHAQSLRQLTFEAEENKSSEAKSALEALTKLEKKKKKKRKRKKRKDDAAPDAVVVDPASCDPLELHTHVSFIFK